ncbi:MAG TPA: hypothetical protein VH063_06020 [Gaiellaceae bacterium]|jgi:hypothetical protein|nr:hypothetical protein [Gaiellaceae bacterium]
MAEHATSATELSELSEEKIRHRAYEISLGPDAGTDEENWIRAEAELHGGSSTSTPPRSVRKRPASASDEA